jgi:chorismate--pyruvate lyase
LRYWLQAEGSLTTRLRAHGQVEVRVQWQGTCALWASERSDLHVPHGYVREVVLLLNGIPAVWARSATTRRAIQGPWRAMQGLGARPLAELLFAQSHVEREPLRAQHLPRGGLQAHHIQSQWQALALQTEDTATPRWARSSVFWRHGHPLRVMEAFSPWVSAL